MEVIFAIFFAVAILTLVLKSSPQKRTDDRHSLREANDNFRKRPITPIASKPKQKTDPNTKLRPKSDIIKGKAWVIDGDTIVISGTHIRLAGIDAPELNHPWGKKSKFAMVELCKGQIVTAHVEPHMSYDRIVATCTLDDGRDLSAELVKMGLALDWPTFSGGKYADLEPDGIRKKHWRAAAKQQGWYNQEKHG